MLTENYFSCKIKNKYENIFAKISFFSTKLTMTVKLSHTLQMPVNTQMRKL